MPVDPRTSLHMNAELPPPGDITQGPQKKAHSTTELPPLPEQGLQSASADPDGARRGRRNLAQFFPGYAWSFLKPKS
jgi:hypothetical protein